MRHLVGLDDIGWRAGRRDQVVYDTDRLINGHILLCGMSGTGKTFQSMRLLNAAVKAGLEIDVFDVHEELAGVAGATAVKYSQATRYGYNPLEVDPDPHVGGPGRQADFLVDLVRATSSAFGSRQEAVLRNLAMQVFQQAGVDVERPATWRRKAIDEKTREKLIAENEFAKLREYYPTLADLQAFAKRKIMALTIGADSRAAAKFEELNRAIIQMRAANNKLRKSVADEEEIAKLDARIETLKGKSHDLYGQFLESIETGREIDDILSFDSAETLASVLRRFDLINAAGIFNANPPPFGAARARVHEIKSLSDDSQVLFVKLALRRIFDEVKKQGPTANGVEMRRVVFLDEAHKYFSKDPSDILNVVAKEARKFGLGLWCASQQPTEFPESFLTNVGATVLLGVHSAFWGRTSSMLRISEDQLRAIRPKQTLALKLQEAGQAEPAFRGVVVGRPEAA